LNSHSILSKFEFFNKVRNPIRIILSFFSVSWLVVLMTSKLKKSTFTFPSPPPWYELYDNPENCPLPAARKCMSFGSQVSINTPSTLKEFGVEELFETVIPFEQLHTVVRFTSIV
jgi:hypothetical protein